MTIRLSIDGSPAGTIQFPGGLPIVSNDSWQALDHLPVPIFPYLDPQKAQRVLVGLSSHDHLIPRLGLLHVEVRP